jgi:glycosyltransferase involved in cell wall biosynthesis
MHVAIFTDNDFEKVNGVTTTLRAVLEHAPPGIHPRVYTASNHAVDEPEYLALRSIGLPIPFYKEMRVYVPRVREFRRRALADHVDVIHLTTPGPVGLAAMRVSRQLNIPMVGSFHTDLAAYANILSGWPLLGGAMREYMRWPYGRCARVLAPSADTRQLLIGANGDARRIEIWRRGVDSTAFSPSHRSEALRRAWRVSPECPAVLYVGRVSREKGLHLLPAIQHCLRELGLTHRFVIAGHGPMLGELQWQLRDAVFTGVLTRDEAAVAFASADVFVFPSRTDTAANVVLEAQASGLPVLVSEAGGPKENIVDGTTGHMVTGTDPISWARALTTLLRYADVRHTMGREARAYAESRTWRRALEPLYRTYRELAAQSAPSSATSNLLPRGAPLS